MYASAYLRDNTQMFNSSSGSVDGKVILICLTINLLKEHRLMISEWYFSDSISASSNKCVSQRKDIGIPIMVDAASPFNQAGWNQDPKGEAIIVIILTFWKKKFWER